jgi:hypothetical protein
MMPWWKIICQPSISPAHENIMKKINAGILATVSLAVVSSVASAQTSASQTTLVTVENYNRAQTDVNFAGVVKNGGFGKFRHGRERSSRPTGHCPAQPRHVVFVRDCRPRCRTGDDYTARPTQAIHGDAGRQSGSIHPGHLLWRGHSHPDSRDGCTRYAIVVVRFFVDFSNEEDVRQVHALQDEIRFSQKRPGTFEVPYWDEASLKKLQAALQQLRTTLSDTQRMFGANEKQVDPVKHLIGSAMLWGGTPEKDTLYLPITPARNDANTIYRLAVKDIPEPHGEPPSAERSLGSRRASSWFIGASITILRL